MIIILQQKKNRGHFTLHQELVKSMLLNVFILGRELNKIMLHSLLIAEIVVGSSGSKSFVP